jgi:group I intron endonuclease
MPFIYKTVNSINGKIYIGKSNKNNSTYIGSGLKIKVAIKKYGRDNFTKEILEECDRTIVSAREKYWIQLYNSTNDAIGYNISAGGEGGDHYWTTLTLEQKVEHNYKISEGKKGKPRGPHSEETKKKIRANQPNDPNWYKRRAEQKMRWFTVIDHVLNQVYFTKNLKDLCSIHSLNYSNMLYNARTKKTFYENRWSCRKEKMTGTDYQIIKAIDTEIKSTTERIKSVVGKNSKIGEKNPMFNKKHSEITKKKIGESRRKKNEES